ncbi:B-cell receptor CD22-like [Cebidichthys violaceus]|uniref:B-cell receptor CD22-like n=1 Tax=Cebidichthys violaceus TaxID=271503 RepID=UPI0035C966CE
MCHLERIGVAHRRGRGPAHSDGGSQSFILSSALPFSAKSACDASAVVRDAPKLPSVSVSSSAEIVEGSSVTLTCSSDANPAANYTWYKKDEDSPKASGQIFIITDFRAEHSGSYYCEAQNNRGRSNSTLHLAVVAGAWRLIAAATVPAFFLAIILISVFLWTIRRKSSKQPSERGERPDDWEQMHPAEEQDGLHYASVHFHKKQADPVYSNIGPARPGRYEDAETIVYAAVKFKVAASRTRDLDAAEDPAALYSTVNKKRNL